MTKQWYLFAFLVVTSFQCFTSVDAKDYKYDHPRIYCTDAGKDVLQSAIEEVEWKEKLVEKKKARVDKYLKLCKKDPEWLVSRLQMNWKTKHTDVYLKGGNFSHSDGEAPVPTVRYSGTRDWATDYKTPPLEEVTPYFDDERGMYFKNGKTGEMEWVHPSKIGHGIEKINRNILSIVEDAAFLYWYTGQKKYAELAAPVFNTYIEGMYYRNAPQVIDDSSQKGISGLATFEVIHEKVLIHLTVAYDFLYQYLEKEKFETEHTAAVFQKWADQIIKNGIPDNNWNLFQARFLTYVAMVLEDDDVYANGKGQQYYLKNTFEVSSDRQIALKESILVYDQESGIWPESPSYSMHVTSTLLEILTLLDNVSNENELSNFPIIEKAALAAFQYQFPNGYTVGFGDSGHGVMSSENCELLISNYRKYEQTGKEAQMTAILSKMIEAGQYKRTGKEFFELFFYVNDLTVAEDAEERKQKPLVTPTFYAPGVSWFAQRLGEDHEAVMVSTVGSYGNHGHANGIALELYANGYVMGPDMGRGSSYWHPDFKEYYAKPAAHNTVVVDGKTTYANMRCYHPFVLENNYPASGSTSDSFDKLTYSKVSFEEPETHSDQERLSAIVKCPAGGAYVVDIFNSKKQEAGAQRHEYIYHNIGQSLVISDKEGQALDMEETDELSSAKGDIKGYDYFNEKRKTMSDTDVNAVFRLSSEGQSDHLMKMWINGEEDQTIFTVKAPKSNALSKGTAPKEVLGKEISTVILRREHEAWGNPFTVVFNPYVEDAGNPLMDVEYLNEDLGYGSQSLLVSHAKDDYVDYIVANTSDVSLSSTDDLYQKGLLSIYRQNDTTQLSNFMFLSGMVQYRYAGWEVIASMKPVTVSIERVGDTLNIQNDKPVVLRIPMTATQCPDVLVIMEDGVEVARRKGLVCRGDSNQREFRLERAYNNAQVILKDR